MNINGSIIQAYVICPRKAWLMSRQISGDQYNEFLAIGRLYSEETYKKDKKEIIIAGNKIDIVKEENGELLLIEVKKSSKRLEASKMQLLNYLYTLAKMGHKVKGEIRVPKEKKVIPVEFGDSEKKIIEDLYQEVEAVIKKEKSPPKKWLGTCKTCSYNEFCWS